MNYYDVIRAPNYVKRNAARRVEDPCLDECCRIYGCFIPKTRRTINSLRGDYQYDNTDHHYICEYHYRFDVKKYPRIPKICKRKRKKDNSCSRPVKKRKIPVDKLLMLSIAADYLDNYL